MKILQVIILLFALALCSARKSKNSRRLSGPRIHRSVPTVIDRRKNFCRECEKCDPLDGCTKCQGSLFLHLEHNEKRNREVGRCHQNCPNGYYGSRDSTNGNRCLKCPTENCAVCFSGDYCMECEHGYHLSDSKCVKECPSGMVSGTDAKKCVQEVDCEVAAWSSWSSCTLRSQKKSCKYGRKKRTRVILKEPSENGRQCPRLKESKRCRTPSDKCLMVNKLYQRQLRRRSRTRIRKAKKGRKGKHPQIQSNDVSRSSLSNKVTNT